MADRIIDVLKRAKWEHYYERSGLDSCPAGSIFPGECDCGAAEINAEIDALIADIEKRTLDNHATDCLISIPTT